MITLFITYAVVGSIAGILAGLLGVGGGLVIVPMLAYCFTDQGVPYEQIMHLALGTSMASIMFTSISSFMAHHRRGAVNWNIVRRIVPGILVGTLMGSLIAGKLSTLFLSIFFILFLYYVAVQLILDRKPSPSRQLPETVGMFGAGGIIGIVSSFVGIGGGSLSVPFMIWCNIPTHNAIGTSAAIGFPIAVAGTVGYITAGLNTPNLPAFSWGFVYLPALFGIACASVLTAPFGASLAHRLPVKKLKQVFAVLLVVMGTRMVIGFI